MKINEPKQKNTKKERAEITNDYVILLILSIIETLNSNDFIK
jgi:hypothetical protein